VISGRRDVWRLPFHSYRSVFRLFLQTGCWFEHRNLIHHSPQFQLPHCMRNDQAGQCFIAISSSVPLRSDKLHSWYTKSSKIYKQLSCCGDLSDTCGTVYIFCLLPWTKAQVLSKDNTYLQLKLTLNLLTWRIWWAPNNASKGQMRFNSAFKGLKQCLSSFGPQTRKWVKFLSSS